MLIPRLLRDLKTSKKAIANCVELNQRATLDSTLHTKKKSALTAPDQTIYEEFLIMDFKWASAEALYELLIFLLRVISFRSQGSEDSRRSHRVPVWQNRLAIYQSRFRGMYWHKTKNQYLSCCKLY